MSSGVSSARKFVEGRVVGLTPWNADLFSIQVGAAVKPFRAGQFGRLALPHDGEMIARPYSFVNAPSERPLEFYFIVLRDGPLTQRLANLKPADAIWIAPQASGLMTLADAPTADYLWLLSTGTAIGPFLSICKTDEPWQRFKKVVLVHAVRYASELSYQVAIRGIAAARGERFVYVPFVSREDHGFAIRGRVPQAIEDGRLEAHADVLLVAASSQVMICGNPEMVKGTRHVLEARGFKKNRRSDPGQITVEAYW